MAAKPSKRSSVREDTHLTEDRKALIERYMIDAEEAEARSGGAAAERARQATAAKRVAEEAARLSAEAKARRAAQAEAKRAASENGRKATAAEATRLAEENARVAAEAEAKRLAAEKAGLAGEAAAVPVDPRSPPSPPSAVEPPSVAATAAAAVAVAPQAEPFASPRLVEPERSPPTSVANAVSPNSCRITWWRGYVRSQFVAQAWNVSDGIWTPIAESPSFSWRSSQPPAETPAAVAAHHELTKTLDTLGWEPDGDGDAWFAARFRRAPESRGAA